MSSMRASVAGLAPAMFLVALSGCAEVLGIGDFTDATSGAGGGLGGHGAGGAGAGGGGGGVGGGPGGAGGGVGTCRLVGGEPSVRWVKSFGGPGNQYAVEAALLPTGLVSVCGQMGSPSTFTVGADTLTNSGGDLDAYVFQLDDQGAPRWALGGGHAGQDYLGDLAADGSETLVVGTFAATIGFDPGHVLGGDGFTHTFLYGLSATGSAVSPLSFVSDSTEGQIGSGVDTFSSGVLVTGTYHGKIGAGGGEALSGSIDAAFASRIHAGVGNDWIVNIGDDDVAGTSSRQSFDSTVDKDDNAVVVGQFTETMTFPAGVELTSEGDADVFIVKLDSTGQFVFAKSFGTVGRDVALAVATDSVDGAIYVAGAHAGAFEFDGVSFQAGGDRDGFLLKLDADGNALWGHSFQGSGLQEARELALDEQGNVYVAGLFDGQFDTPGGPMAGVWDSFVASYSRQGDWCGGFQVSDGGGTLLIGGIDVDADELLVAGNFNDTATVGGSPILTQDAADVLVVSYDLRLSR